MTRNALEAPVVARDEEPATSFSVVRVPTGGWDVRVEVGGRVLERHCSDWHRAERFRQYAETQLQQQVQEVGQ